jgi:hypothetical protein
VHLHGRTCLCLKPMLTLATNADANSITCTLVQLVQQGMEDPKHIAHIRSCNLGCKALKHLPPGFLPPHL